MRRPLLIAAAILAAGAAASLAAMALLAGGESPGRTQLAASRAPTPASVARAFALSYGRYLDGQIAASQLAYAAPAAIADAGPQIRPEARVGALRLVALNASGPSQFAGLLRNLRNTVGFTFALSSSQPPHVIALSSGIPEQIQSSPPPPAAPERAAEQAAAQFLRVYVLFLYGEARLDQLPDITPAYRARLEQTFHVPAALKGLPARLVGGIQMKAVGSGWQAWTSITDGQQQYVIAADVLDEHGRWLVNNVTLS